MWLRERDIQVPVFGQGWIFYSQMKFYMVKIEVILPMQI